MRVCKYRKDAKQQHASTSYIYLLFLIVSISFMQN